MFLRQEIIDALTRSEEKNDEKMEKFLQKITDSVGAQLHGMNSTIVKMKEEGDDRYKQISERHKDEKYENRSDEPRGAHVDQNPVKAVITGFHSETSEPEVIQLLKESITEIGMTIENARIECPAKQITHAFIHFKNDDERKIHQVSEHVEKGTTRKKVEDNATNGRRGKIPSKKNGVRQVLHSRETYHSSRFDNCTEAHSSQRPDCAKAET